MYFVKAIFFRSSLPPNSTTAFSLLFDLAIETKILRDFSCGLLLFSREDSCNYLISLTDKMQLDLRWCP
jgi:hypothetical protein